MIYIYRLRNGFLKIQKIMQTEGRNSDIAQQFSLEAIEDSKDNVVHVDFKGTCQVGRG
ncbi:hypothetical protein IVA95_27650 [Bradyrhizobium sp. 157]|uniref:hypothetical protein n=1 Tax=Bradyrhizobium sp. 157 TaxID=2782631 RepID=UPI001FF8D970|nr:hypothetical protein [Bradyrhizobium sp. 157]MCK1641258.1 hypothetical protein [Bradyrhizobium sp. 157]